MSQERRPCHGVDGRGCRGTGVSRRPGACSTCLRTCACGKGKTELAVSCKDCSGTKVRKTLACIDCGEPKKSIHGERCRACVALLNRGHSNDARLVSFDSDSYVPPERRDYDDTLARVLAFLFGGSL